MSNNLYDINNYTDQQLFDILDMNNPTDRELEAKIIHMINKYENIQNTDGNRLANFFKDIYNHFFDLKEGIDETIEIKDPNENIQKTQETIQTKQIGYTAPVISAVQQFDYSPDKLQLNPLLKQTIKRVISIDSQYRNVTTYPSTTNFTFDLSEPLRDVLSLKLYSIQIPYTWYTISKSYGSNFFYLKGNKDGINDGTHDYKVAIPVGNYSPVELINAINISFNTLITTSASDVQFNGNIVSYNSANSRTTFNIDLQKTYTESYYKLFFPTWSLSYNISDELRNTIPSYLGFTDTSYNFNYIRSNSTNTYTLTTFINSEIKPLFNIDNLNNFFTIKYYIGSSIDKGYENDTLSNIIKTITISLDLTSGLYTRNQIISAVNTAIIKTGYFTTDSKIEQIDLINNLNINYQHSYFKMTIIFDRYKIKYIPNGKICIIFPVETPYTSLIDNIDRTVWTIQPGIGSSCFAFDISINELSEIISEVPNIQSSFTLDTNSHMKIRLECNKPFYNNPINTIILSVLPTANKTKYTLYEYRDRINASFQSTISNPNTTISNSSLSVDNNLFNMTIDITKNFSEKNYIIDFSDSILTTYFDISTNNPDLSTNNIIISSFTPQSSGYTNVSKKIFSLIPKSDSGIDINNIINVTLSNENQSYDTYIDLILAIKTAIQNKLIDNNLILHNTTLTYNDNAYINNPNNKIDISLNIQYFFNLIEQNYNIFFDSSQNNWQSFQIYPSYNLNNNLSINGTAIITGNNSITGGTQLTLSDTNNNFIISLNSSNIPSNQFQYDLSANPVSLTLNDIYISINRQFTNNPITYGSSISSIVLSDNKLYTKIRININDIYTTQDYKLVFYDPYSFVTCTSGSNSIQNTTWDTTIGWILGFRDYTEYSLLPSNINTTINNDITNTYYLNSINSSYTNITTLTNNITTSSKVTLTGDTTLSTILYNYFLISLDDYIQNHLNDGLVTITRNQTNISTPGYAYSTTRNCDPTTGTLISSSTPQTNSDNVTAKQIYALNQTLLSKRNAAKSYSSGPFVKDLFGLIPIKAPSKNGDYYIEFGGTLQNQERVYFGPVNIRKMTIQLMNDRGDLVDLNGSNWSFSFICEQLYKDTST